MSKLIMSKNELKLNRSLSESNISDTTFGSPSFTKFSVGLDIKIPPVITRSFYIEEVIDGGSSTKIRRYASCKEIIDHQIYHSKEALNTPFTNICSPNYSTNLNCVNSQSIPMDVDRSNDYDKNDKYLEKMDTDLDPCDQEFQIGEHKRNKKLNIVSRRNCKPINLDELLVSRHLEPKSKIVPGVKVVKDENYYMKWLLLAIALFTSYAIYSYSDVNTFVNSDVQLINIRSTLKSEMYGQGHIVDLVIRSLEQREKWKRKIRILAFFGASGVGKTFMSSIIKKQFPRTLVREIYGKQLMYKTLWKDIANSISSSNFHLIIVDDVRKNDIFELFAFINTLPQNDFILILSIFNLYESDLLDSPMNSNSIGEIQNAFDDSGLYYKSALFQKFTKQEVEDWIDKQLAIQQISQHLQDTIKKNVLQEHKVDRHGLKGLDAKLLWELEKHK